MARTVGNPQQRQPATNFLCITNCYVIFMHLVSRGHPFSINFIGKSTSSFVLGAVEWAQTNRGWLPACSCTGIVLPSVPCGLDRGLARAAHAAPPCHRSAQHLPVHHSALPLSLPFSITFAHSLAYTRRRTMPLWNYFART